MEPHRILVVDDEPDILETIQFRLEQEGFQVLTASDGLQGLGAVKAHDPDLVILDVMMPGENGYRVAKMIRADEEAGKSNRRVPIILLTARDLSSDPEREKMFMNFSQADLMIYKPFEMDDLVARIAELLGR